MRDFIRNIKFPTLLFVATGGAIGVSAMHYLLGNKLSDEAARSSFVSSAIECAKNQPELTTLLGSFQIGHPNIRDGWSRVENDHVKVMLPIKGEKDNGQLLTYARRVREGDSMRLYKVEVRFNQIQGKRLILFELGEDELRAKAFEEKPETSKERLARLRKEQLEEIKTKERESKLLKFKQLGKNQSHDEMISNVKKADSNV